MLSDPILGVWSSAFAPASHAQPPPLGHTQSPPLDGAKAALRPDSPAVACDGGESGAELPCLLSNNSDGYRGKLSSLQRKRAETTRRNVARFYTLHGTSTGFLTITFAKGLTTREAQRKLANFKRRVLKTHFGACITVREFTKAGRPHFHIIIDCLGDISTGFNWSYHKEVGTWTKSGRKGTRPKGRLGRTPLLAKLHEILNEKAPLYGLGQVIELTPIEKAEAIGFYVGGYLSKSTDHAPEDAKGTRAVSYSHNCERHFKGAFSWNNESGWLWRAKLAKWAAKHGCHSFEDVAAVFGSRWAYHHQEAILATKLDYYPTSEHAWADGVSFPPDHVDIRITRTERPEEKPVQKQPTDAVPLVVKVPRKYTLRDVPPAPGFFETMTRQHGAGDKLDRLKEAARIKAGIGLDGQRTLKI